MRFIAHILGIDNVSGYWYAWWSGFAGDLSILATPIVLLRKHNCHVRGCPRVGRHPVTGTGWTVCRKHHPEDHPTARDVKVGAPDAD